MSQVALLKEKLARLRGKREALRIEMNGIARDIGPMIDPLLRKPDEMEIATAATLMDGLVVKQSELISLNSGIADLEEALG